ncbi:hypothetical protein ACEQ8H_004827 [Pleosporales sp. CAS-2024a]
MSKDFASLRSTCKELYEKTHYDAAIRFRPHLEKIPVVLHPNHYPGTFSLPTLLGVVKVPLLRDLIRQVEFYITQDDYFDILSPDPPDGDYEVDGIIAQTPWLPQPSGLVESYLNSETTLEILTDCFRHLEKVKSLQSVQLGTTRGHELILGAMARAQFSPRKVASFPIEPTFIDKWMYGRLIETPEEFTPYTKCIRLQPLMPNLDFIDTKLLAATGENRIGLHIQSFRPIRNPDMNRKFMSALTGVEEIEYYGCRPYPGLRLCHGCDDIFFNNFAALQYAHLANLQIHEVFVSGGRLRRFIKRHAETLIHFAALYTTLTDGSWHSIAQGLAKLPQLKHLKFLSLCEKHPARNGRSPAAPYTATHMVELGNQAHVKEFLQMFLAHFDTCRYLNQGRIRARFMVYQVKLFQDPNTEVVKSPSEAETALVKYAYGM